MEPSPLAITNITKKYGDYRGVDNISIELSRGEVFGFLGPNGAGKSTTIRTVLDFLRPTAGDIRIFGLDSQKDSVAIKKMVGYLAGDIALYDTMTGRTVLEYLTSLGKDTDWDYVKTLTKKLDASLDQPLNSLSKGNRQKIGLIQAFMHKPKLIILDEPTSGLDPLMKQVFYDMVLEMRDAGNTVFVSSHDLTEVQKICDRAAFIRDGKLISIEDIRHAKSLNLRRFRATFESAPDTSKFAALKTVSDVKSDGNDVIVTVTGSVGEFVRELAKHNPIDLDEQETDLEDLFMHYYKEGKDA